ncbi:germ cell nuclear acidic protein-like [Ornithodoros turicata]|uniref:germ cell nuclear acidic protein-like n=1 Tax=Ornithodoros turicata TaxID=34597 RepID=UPI00313A3135
MTTPKRLLKRRHLLVAELLDSEDEDEVTSKDSGRESSNSARDIDCPDGSDACGPASKRPTEYEIEVRIDSSYDSDELDVLLERLRTPKTPSARSVAKVRSTIVLSSDSEDEVFCTPKERKAVRRARAASTASLQTSKTPARQNGTNKQVPMTEVRQVKRMRSPTQQPLRRSPRLPQAQESVEEFLHSLSSSVDLGQCTPEVLRFHKHFAAHREELTEKLLRIYNKEVFAEKLPADIPVAWNVRLTSTAGLCLYSKRRGCHLQMSCKIVDRPERLRDTLLHELCHAATSILHGVRGGHGHLFQFWAGCAARRFPQLPPIARCHSYTIRTRFVYSCQNCGGCVRRHSKSVDTSRKVCSRCGGRFVLVQSSSPR